MKINWHNLRSAITYGVGIAGIIHQTVFRDADRPFLLALFATMIGLDAYLRYVKHKNGDGGE